MFQSNKIDRKYKDSGDLSLNISTKSVSFAVWEHQTLLFPDFWYSGYFLSLFMLTNNFNFCVFHFWLCGFVVLVHNVSGWVDMSAMSCKRCTSTSILPGATSNRCPIWLLQSFWYVDSSFTYYVISHSTWQKFLFYDSDCCSQRYCFLSRFFERMRR